MGRFRLAAMRIFNSIGGTLNEGPSGDGLLTEASDFLVTESGEFLTTE